MHPRALEELWGQSGWERDGGIAGAGAGMSRIGRLLGGSERGGSNKRQVGAGQGRGGVHGESVAGRIGRPRDEELRMRNGNNGTRVQIGDIGESQELIGHT